MDISLKRIIAYIIDIALITIIVTLLSNVKIINPYLDTYNEKYNEYTEITEKYKNEEIAKDEYEETVIPLNYELGRSNVVNASITVACLILYFGIGQMLLDGETFGKRIMKIKIVSVSDSKKLNVGNYLIRTIILNNVLFRILIIVGVYFLGAKAYFNFATIIGFIEGIVEAVIIIMIILRKDNRGLHDILATTKVIDLNSNIELEEETPAIESKPKKKNKKEIN